jgi:flagellar hook protein FlgE
MSFNIAISGLNAAQTDLSTTANNIANASTSGFKNGRAQFSDIFTRGSASAGGAGVRVSGVKQEFGQGSIEFTGNELDLAIAGNGFFVVKERDGSTSYTRAGAFSVDSSGTVVNTTGQKLQVYLTGNNGTGGIGDLTLSKADRAPKATTNVELGLNLPANAAEKPGASFSQADSSTYSHSVSTVIYDQQGVAKNATLYFSKTATANQWDVRVAVDGTMQGAPEVETVAFDANGALLPAGGTATAGAISFAALTGVSFSVTDATQRGTAFSVNSIDQDGYTTGRLTGVSVDPAGVISGTYSNGRIEALGQIAIANFNGVDSLQQKGGASWGETVASGPALLGTPGAAGFGQIESNSLEASNVDMTKELVHMITAQRNFQANAKLISASDQLAQTIINLR